MYNRVRLVFLVLVLACVALPQATAHAQNGDTCFAEVPDCISGRFAEYWRQNGGLAVFGYPTGTAAQQQVNRQTVLVQTFERNRFELHAEQPRPYDVLLGRLGDDRLRQLGRPWEAEPKAAATAQAGCAYFAETQHLVCAPFLAYWRAHGLSFDGRDGFSSAESLALFGLPLTEARTESGSDGQPYLTQWFERARFELHAGAGADAVLLGLLGRETSAAPVLSEPAPAAPEPAPAPAAPEPAPTPAAPTCDVPPSEAPVVPPCMLGGSIFVATGRGFAPNEIVNLDWATPDKSEIELGVISGPGRALADGSYPLKAAFNVNAPPGVYTVNMYSKTNHVTLRLRINPYDPGSPPFDNSQIPSAINAEVSEPLSRRGDVLTFQAQAFVPHEEVSIYGEQPDGTGFRANSKFRANNDGKVRSEHLGLQIGDDDPIGMYQITFEGDESGRKAIVYFRVMP